MLVYWWNKTRTTGATNKCDFGNENMPKANRNGSRHVWYMVVEQRQKDKTKKWETAIWLVGCWTSDMFRSLDCEIPAKMFLCCKRWMVIRSRKHVSSQCTSQYKLWPSMPKDDMRSTHCDLVRQRFWKIIDRECKRWMPLVSGFTAHGTALQADSPAVTHITVCLVTVWGALGWGVI